MNLNGRKVTIKKIHLSVVMLRGSLKIWSVLPRKKESLKYGRFVAK